MEKQKNENVEAFSDMLNSIVKSAVEEISGGIAKLEQAKKHLETARRNVDYDEEFDEENDRTWSEDYKHLTIVIDDINSAIAWAKGALEDGANEEVAK